MKYSVKKEHSFNEVRQKKQPQAFLKQFKEQSK